MGTGLALGNENKNVVQYRNKFLLSYSSTAMEFECVKVGWGGGNKGLEVGPFQARLANPFQTHKIVLLGVANGANLLLLLCLVSWLAALFLC